MAVILGNRPAGGTEIEKFELNPDTQPPIASFAALLRRYRDAAELTQEELAERAGLSVRAISDLERGITPRPQRTTIRLLAEGLGLAGTDLAALEAAVPSRHRRVDDSLRLLDLPVGGFLGAAPDNPLVARAGEIARSRELVDIVRRGDGRLLLLSGEPGVGKTRLAQEVTLISRAAGMYLTTGRCYEPQQNVPFAPFLEPLTRLVTVARDRLSLDPLQRWPQLARLVPSHPLPPSENEGAQQRLFWAVTGLLEALAGHIPITIALDDLHWADRSSLLLLQHLAPQIRHIPVLLLATYRDLEVEPDGPLARLLRDLHRERLAEEIDIHRLSHDETRELIASTLGGGEIAADLAGVVHRHTEGNAFFVQEVTRALTERGEVFERGGVWEYRATAEIAIPHTVQEAIRERINRLSQPAQALLEEASVLGQTFTFDDLHAMAGQSEEAIEEYLAEATRASVVRIAEQESYTFNHALTQRVLYREQPPRQRKRLHLRAGTAISQQPEHLRDQRTAELAWHLVEGGEPQLALPFVLLAADQAASTLAFAEAESQYRMAVHLAHKSQDDAREAAAFEGLGAVLVSMGRFDEALESLEHASTMYRSLGDRLSEIRSVAYIGRLHRERGTSEVGIARLEPLLESLNGSDPLAARAELYSALTNLYHAAGRYSESLDSAEQASDLAREIGDQKLLAEAELRKGSALAKFGRMSEAFEISERVVALTESTGDIESLHKVLTNTAFEYVYAGEFDRAVDLLERVLEKGRQQAWIFTTIYTEVVLSRARFYRGDWEEAYSIAQRALQSVVELGPSWYSSYALSSVGVLELVRGNHETALHYLNESLAMADSNLDLQAQRYIQVWLAQEDIRTGQAEAAVSRLEPLLDRVGVEEVEVTAVMPTLALAYAAGDLSKAGRVSAEAVRRARSERRNLSLADALVAMGSIRAHAGEALEAERAFKEALQLARRMPYPYARAKHPTSGDSCLRPGAIRRRPVSASGSQA